MAEHEYPSPIWDNLTEGKMFCSSSLRVFKEKLKELTQKVRRLRGGDLLILETHILEEHDHRFGTSLGTRIKLAERLAYASFKDMGNYSAFDFVSNSTTCWWRNKLGYDVVCIPGFTEDRKIIGCYRVFTRPTFLS